MKQFALVIALLSILVGCAREPDITEQQATRIVEQRHTNSFGKAEVLSIDYRWGRYVVEWENAGDCQWGTDHVDGKSGETEIKQASIC